jgi:hypothetical protein
MKRVLIIEHARILVPFTVDSVKTLDLIRGGFSQIWEELLRVS